MHNAFTLEIIFLNSMFRMRDASDCVYVWSVFVAKQFARMWGRLKPITIEY